jgi:hypothetical protein
MKINENQWISMKINENQWKSMKINENQWKSMKIYANLWKSMKINENQWKSMNIYNAKWKSMKFNENQWKSINGALELLATRTARNTIEFDLLGSFLKLPGKWETLKWSPAETFRDTQKHSEIFQDIQRYSETFRDIQRHPETFRDIQWSPGAPGDQNGSNYDWIDLLGSFLKPPGKWETSKWSPAETDTQRHSETFRHIQTHSETFRHIQRHSETFRDIQRHSKTFNGALELLTTRTARNTIEFDLLGSFLKLPGKWETSKWRPADRFRDIQRLATYNHIYLYIYI